jgi:aminoglycoside phosphotransferase (APT) family kinase protein
VVKLRRVRLHDGEIDIDVANVRHLLAEQVPDLARLDIREVHTTGTVNRIFRIGQELYARMPRTEKWASDLEQESRLAATLAPHLPLRVPERVVAGAPGAWYPFQWAIYRWLDGEPYADDLVDDEVRAAADVIAAWTVFGSAGRAAYRDELGVDDVTWRRARGYALIQVMGIGYYRDTNPGFAALALRTVREVLNEFAEKI